MVKYVIAIALAFGLLYGDVSAQCPNGQCPSASGVKYGPSPFAKYQIVTAPQIAQAAPGCPDRAWTSLATGKTLYEHSDGIWREYRQGHAGETGPNCPCDNGKCPCDREKPTPFPTGPGKK